jgi:hypothetical protein
MICLFSDLSSIYLNLLYELCWIGTRILFSVLDYLIEWNLECISVLDNSILQWMLVCERIWQNFIYFSLLSNRDLKRMQIIKFLSFREILIIICSRNKKNVKLNLETRESIKTFRAEYKRNKQIICHERIQIKREETCQATIYLINLSSYYFMLFCFHL